MTPVVKKRPLPRSDALALSLYVVGDEVNGDEPIPLRMYHPNLPAGECLRRSPRFTPNNRGSMIERSAGSGELIFPPALSLCASRLRRSPRITAGSDARNRNSSLKRPDAALPSNSKKWLFDSSKNGRCLRSRTVPMRADGSALCDSSTEPPSKKVKTSSSSRSNLTRSSPRLSSSSSVGIGKNNASVKGNLLALAHPSPSSVKQSCKRTNITLRECDSNILGERRLRSRTVPILQVGTGEDVNSKSVSIGIFDVSANRNPGQRIKSDFGRFDPGKKSTGSRTIPFRHDGTEDVETKSDLIEFCDVLGNKKHSEGIMITSGSCDTDGMDEKCLRSRIVPPCAVASENEDTESALPDVSAGKSASQRIKVHASSEEKEKKKKTSCFCIGDPVPDEEARERWQWRYELKVGP
ncbi:hypothetical protein U1Q18_021596 [Sarracenia purpurea var. burkii]